MKKLLYSVIGLAVLFTACQQEAVGPDDGDIVETTFTLDMGPGTKAYSDGTTATDLHVLVYGTKTDGTYQYLPNISKTGETKIATAFTALKAQVTLKLVKGVNYDVVFWAQNPAGPYTLDPANGTMTVNAEGNANLEARDAFYAKVATGLISSTNKEFTAQLKRPFAQINVMTPLSDWNAAVDNGIVFSGSSMNVISAPNVLNLRSGALTGTAEYKFAPAAVTPDDAYATAYAFGGETGCKYIAMNYVLASDTQALAEVKFAVYRDGLAEANLLNDDFDLNNVPFRANYRTNIVGNIFSVDGVFQIEIVPGYGGENEFPLEGEPQTITVPAGIPLAAATDFSFNATTGTGTATVAQGETLSFAGLTSDSGFPAQSYTSSNTAVGTINSAGLFTAVAPGTTNITVHFNSVQDGVLGTKADAETTNYASTEVVFVVTVPEPPVVEQVAKPTFSVAAGEVESGTTVKILCATEGADIYYTVDESVPTSASTKYTEPIAITEAVTIKAIAVKSGMTDSEVASAAYTIAVPPTPPTPEPMGTGTLEDPYTAAGAIDFITGESFDENAEVYVKGKISSIKYSFDVAHGTGTFNISDDGTAEAAQFTAYGVYFLENQSWKEWNTQIAVGDEVILFGKVCAYETKDSSGNVTKVDYETVNKNAHIYALNGITAEAEPALFGVEKTAINVSASATTATINVTGNVAWTATCNNAAFTLDKTSGEGAESIAVSFEANTDTESAKVATVTVTTTADVETTTFEVVITQAKAASTDPGSELTASVVIGEYAEANSWANSTRYETIAVDEVITATALFDAGKSNTGKYYTSGTDWRFYQNEGAKLQISAGESYQLLGVTLTYTINNTAKLSYGETVLTSEEYIEVSGTSAEFVVGNSGTATNGQIRFTKIEVKYKAAN